MQAFTYMKPHSSPSTSGARERLLAAAARVFAQDGLAGATTRAIADEAGVNEVTLFRHFRSKDGLIAAVVSEYFGAGTRHEAVPIPAPSDDFRADLFTLGQLYEKLLTANLPLLRTMIGETHHTDNCSHEKQVFRAIFQPLKEAFHSRVTAAQKAGEITSSARTDILADLFLGMIFTGVLRRSVSHIKIDYPATAYLETAVDLFLRGAVPERKAR